MSAEACFLLRKGPRSDEVHSTTATKYWQQPRVETAVERKNIRQLYCNKEKHAIYMVYEQEVVMMQPRFVGE